jgi:ribosomal protein S27AE
MSQADRIERAKKPRKCPACGHAPMASILYGEPAFDERLERELAEGKVSLGGCCDEMDGPAWECTRCGVKVFRS